MRVNFRPHNASLAFEEVADRIAELLSSPDLSELETQYTWSTVSPNLNERGESLSVVFPPSQTRKLTLLNDDSFRYHERYLHVDRLEIFRVNISEWADLLP